MTTPDERLDAAIGAAGGSSSNLDALARAAREELAKQPTVRPWFIDGVIVFAVTALLGIGGVFGFEWSEQQHGSAFTKFGVAAAWVALMAFGSLLWVKPGRASLLVLGGFVVAATFTLFGASGVATPSPFFNGLGCGITEVVASVLPVMTVLMVSRRFAARSMHVVAGALAASSAGALALHFHCSNGTVAHVGVWHLLPALVVALLAALLRTRLRSSSFAP